MFDNEIKAGRPAPSTNFSKIQDASVFIPSEREKNCSLLKTRFLYGFYIMSRNED
jgi:hypothetical protein